MSIATIKRLVALLCVSWLAACGGGGGGGGGGGQPDVEVAYDVSRVRATAFENQQEGVNASSDPSVDIQASLDGELSGTVYVVVAATGVGFEGSPVEVTQVGQGVYRARLRPNLSLAPGTYTGQLALRLCKDAACAQEYSVGGGTLPYQVTIVPQLAATILVNGTSVGTMRSGQSNFQVSLADGDTVEIRTNTPAAMLYSTGPGFVTATVDPASTATSWKAVIALDSFPTTHKLPLAVAPKDGTDQYAVTIDFNVAVN